MAIISGTEDDDLLIGTEEDDSIFGLGGNDLIDALGGNDFVDGGDGDDFILGGEGNDTLLGSLGNDVIVGGGGVDDISGGEGNDDLSASDLADAVVFGESLRGGQGNDTFRLNANSLDPVVIENVDEGTDTVISGLDFYTLADNVENLTLESAGAFDLGGAGNALNNRITGDFHHNIIYGGAGDDTVNGASGNDSIFGDDGNDSLLGGLGDDIIGGGTGTNTLEGGLGDDYYYTNPQDVGSRNIINDSAGISDFIDLTAFNFSDIRFDLIDQNVNNNWDCLRITIASIDMEIVIIDFFDDTTTDIHQSGLGPGALECLCFADNFITADMVHLNFP